MLEFFILYRKEGWYMNVKGWTAGYHNDGTALLSKFPEHERWSREGRHQ